MIPSPIRAIASLLAKDQEDPCPDRPIAHGSCCCFSLWSDWSAVRGPVRALERISYHEIHDKLVSWGRYGSTTDFAPEIFFLFPPKGKKSLIVIILENQVKT